MRKIIAILGLFGGIGIASPFWCSAGLHADWLSQGLSLRALYPTGLGFHLVGYWFHKFKETPEENMAYEFRVEKMFLMPRRVRPYVGLGMGRRYYGGEEFTGGAGVFGVDVILLQGRSSTNGHPSHGLSLNIEVLMGIFKDYWGPAGGGGVYYNW